MGGALSLIKTDFEQLEKRILPRYPLCYLTFKEVQSSEKRVFQVKEISLTGMQLCLKNGDLNYKEDDVINGCLHWIGQSLDSKCHVKWIRGNLVGVAFVGGEDFQKTVSAFMSPQNMASHMRPIPFQELDYEIPTDLETWLRADGPADIFIWKYKDEALSKFQLILMSHFVEWEDGKGLLTGTVKTQRSLDLPLAEQDEVVFKVDETLDIDKLKFATDVLSKIGDDKLDLSSKNFLVRKLKG